MTTAVTPIDDLNGFVQTRTSWHILAEHVLAKARWAADGHIGLRASDGGVATPAFGTGERVLLVDTTIVHELHGAVLDRAPITTVGAAADLVGVEPGASPDVYPPTTTFDVEAPLFVEARAAATLGAWFAFGDGVLRQWRSEHDDDSPSTVQLWPEHFDLACDLGDEAGGTRANYGASPGDAAIPEPYLYVGPWDTSRIDTSDGFWNQSWGAALPYAQLVAARDPSAAAIAFFAHGRLRLVEG